jgi:hypothetical protein
MVTVFALPAILGALPLAGRAAWSMLRRRRRAPPHG